MSENEIVYDSDIRTKEEVLHDFMNYKMKSTHNLGDHVVELFELHILLLDFILNDQLPYALYEEIRSTHTWARTLPPHLRKDFWEEWESCEVKPDGPTIMGRIFLASEYKDRTQALRSACLRMGRIRRSDFLRLNGDGKRQMKNPHMDPLAQAIYSAGIRKFDPTNFCKSSDKFYRSLSEFFELNFV